MDAYYFTEKGYAKIHKEVEEIQRFLKNDIAKEIGTAREHGDLRENAEYEAAKQKQANYGAKLSSLQMRLAGAWVIKKEDLPPDIVTLGKKVTIRNIADDSVKTYSILGDGESDISKSIISYLSPLAKQLMKHKQGDTVAVKLPRGEKVYEIMAIEFIDDDE